MESILRNTYTISINAFETSSARFLKKTSHFSTQPEDLVQSFVLEYALFIN
jgi:hypothetical protein